MARDGGGAPSVSVETDGGVAIVRLDRPEHLNAFTGRMGHELGAAYAACDADDSVRALVVTGAGRAFCAGADLSSGGDTFASPDQADFTASPVQPAAWEVRKPVIAAINGHAVGIGLTIAMQCDIRIVADTAKCGFVHVRRGVIPDLQAHWTLPRVIGLSRAADLLLTGRILPGPEAVEMGLASRALPAPDVLDEAVRIARDIAVNTAPLSVGISKRLLWEATTASRDEIARLETDLHRHVMGRSDAQEGVLAFLEGRAPTWQMSVSRDWPAGWG